MLLKVYNQNGKVKITKTMNHMELTLFSDLPEGEVAEIEIGVSEYSTGKKRKIKDTPSKSNETEENPFAHAIAVLRFARDNQCLTPEDAGCAIAVLEGKWGDPKADAVYKDLLGLISFKNAIAILQFAANTDMSLTTKEAELAIQKLKDVITER